MNMLLPNIANVASSLRSFTFFRSALVSVSLLSCLNSEIPEIESRVSFTDGSPEGHASAPASLMKIGQNVVLLSPGSHLVSPRKFYVHHGIYLGEGKVAHYSGLSGSLRAGPIEVTDLRHFANGRSVWVYEDQPAFSSDEIIFRARSRVGESQYRIFSNNCEHFCNWCIKGTSYSAQVAEYLHYPLRLIGRMFAHQLGFIA